MHGKEGGFYNNIYGLSLHALKRVKEKSPGTTIIAYTGAPEYIRKRCVEEGLADHLIHRDMYGIGIEMAWIKDILAGGSGYSGMYEEIARKRRLINGGSKWHLKE
jgi:hypothetical protein